MTLMDVVAAVQDGAADDNLDAVIDAAVQRRKVLAQRNASTFKPGDRVALGTNIRPTYLRGQTGTFVRRDGGRILVLMDDPERASRFVRTYGPEKGVLRAPMGSVVPL